MLLVEDVVVAVVELASTGGETVVRLKEFSLLTLFGVSELLWFEFGLQIEEELLIGLTQETVLVVSHTNTWQSSEQLVKIPLLEGCHLIELTFPECFCNTVTGCPGYLISKIITLFELLAKVATTLISKGHVSNLSKALFLWFAVEEILSPLVGEFNASGDS